MIDLLVAGGGPVGLATALYARKAGLEVVVLEPRTGPIDKACGEGLMPEAVSRLAHLGVDPPGRDFHGIRYLDGRRFAEARFTKGPGRGVRRTTLVDAMTESARDAGVRFLRARVTAITQTAEAVLALDLKARYLIAADGLHSPVRALIGAARPARGPQRFGVRQHFLVEPWTDLVEVHLLRTAEVYITPVSTDVVGFAVLGGRPLNLQQALESLPDVSARLKGAVPASPERGAGPLRQDTTARVVGRVLLVGDAAGYVDALTGEGLRMGFAEAEAAVAAVTRDDPTAYAQEWVDITRSYRRLTSALLWAGGRPKLRRLIVPSARLLPGVFRRGVDALAE